MIGIDDALIFSKAGITLLPGIVDVVRKIRSSDHDPSLQAIIDQLITQTREQCRRLREEIGLLEHSIREFGGGYDKRLSDLYEDIHRLSFLRKAKLNNHKRAIQNIHNALSSSVDDLVSVLLCSGRVASLKDANAITRAVRSDLDSLSFGDEKTLGEILTLYRKVIDHWVEELI